MALRDFLHSPLGLILGCTMAAAATLGLSSDDDGFRMPIPSLSQSRLASIPEHDGPLAPDSPLQLAVTPQEATPLTLDGGFTLTPVRRYGLTALVLNAKRYRLGRLSEISPVDLSVGWAELSDPALLQHMSFNQSNRRGRFWLKRGAPTGLDMEAIETRFANMHLIAADPRTEAQLKAARAGMVVTLQGYLVDIEGPNGAFWETSTTRTDTNGGACEIMLVTDMTFIDPNAAPEATASLAES